MARTLIETIRAVDGHFHLLGLHESRMRASCLRLYGTGAPALALRDEDIPEDLRHGTVKCRVTYSTKIANVEYEPYTPRTPRTLRLVRCEEIDYQLKYADRTPLNRLHTMRDGADEVIIVRDGLVTDTTYSNLLFHSAGRLLTPSRPLLPGVMRRHLLDTGVAHEADITPEMLRPGGEISAVTLINAMLPPGTIPPIPMTDIYPLP